MLHSLDIKQVLTFGLSYSVYCVYFYASYLGVSTKLNWINWFIPARKIALWCLIVLCRVICAQNEATGLLDELTKPCIMLSNNVFQHLM